MSTDTHETTGATDEPAEAEGDGEEKKVSKAERDTLARMAEAFDKIDRLLLRLGLQGLQRMTGSSAAELQALQQTAHNAALIAVEREIEKLATHVQRYLDRDPLFTMSAYLDTLNRIWLLNAAARRRHAEGALPRGMVDVIGEARRSYEQLAEPITIQPLGASGWVSDTGFVGVTIYFYAEGRPGAVLQATNCKPTMYFGTDPRHLLRQPISDTVLISTADVAHGAFELRNAKLSRDGRLSLHRELQVRKAPYIGGRAYQALAVSSWLELLGRLREGQLHPVEASSASEVFVEPAEWGEIAIDEKTQRATADLLDESGAALRLEVPLRQENNFLVDNLELMLGADGRRRKLVPSALFGRAWIAEGRLKLAPYSAIYNQAVVLSDHGQRRVNEVHLSLESLRNVKEA